MHRVAGPTPLLTTTHNISLKIYFYDQQLVKSYITITRTKVFMCKKTFRYVCMSMWYVPYLSGLLHIILTNKKVTSPATTARPPFSFLPQLFFSRHNINMCSTS